MRKIVLNHSFVNRCPNIDEFFKVENGTGVICTMNAFCNRVKKLAQKYSLSIDENEFKGAALELFVEYMIKTGAEDNRIGIYDYEPVLEDDFGVDGVGIGENGNPATVQVKFRRGDWVLTANEDHLSNFMTSSVFDYHVHIEDDKNMLIVTTGLKVDEFTLESMLKEKVRVLNRDDLRNMYDNKYEWWLRFYESVKHSVAKKDKVKRIKLRIHQEESVEAVLQDDNGRGRVILPTGTGKTLIEADIICKVIEQCKREGNLSPVIKINASRILLCFQLFNDMLPRFLSHGIDAKYFNYNSGNFKDDSKYATLMRKQGMNLRDIESTTSVKHIKNVYNTCKREKVPLIIFSTYHSAEKLAVSKIPVDLTINDEAHNLVSNNFHRVVMLPSERSFFFTATEKITNDENGYGMDNEARFDNLIYNKSARELIVAGEMVAPALHIVRSSNSFFIDEDYEKMFESIVEAFFFHEKKIKELSYSASDIGAKVLIVCRDQMALQEMFKTNSFDNFKSAFPDVHIFALSSDFGIYNDGKYEKPMVTNIKKHRLLQDMKALGNNEKALIFHVDMIGEGIDVPGITGIMPFRNCEESKLIQNTGRSTRLHPVDRRRFYAGEIDPFDRSVSVNGNIGKWIKPFSWVIIPSYMVDTEGMEKRFTNIVKRLREEFGYIPRQHTVISNQKGLSDEEEIEAVNEKLKSKKRQKSGVNGFEHEFEKVSAIEKIIFDMEVEDKKKEIMNQVDLVVLDR